MPKTHEERRANLITRFGGFAAASILLMGVAVALGGGMLGWAAALGSVMAWTGVVDSGIGLYRMAVWERERERKDDAEDAKRALAAAQPMAVLVPEPATSPANATRADGKSWVEAERERDKVATPVVLH
jgi:hypothetical protein